MIIRDKKEGQNIGIIKINNKIKYWIFGYCGIAINGRQVYIQSFSVS
jgi:hypothetical protein